MACPGREIATVRQGFPQVSETDGGVQITYEYDVAVLSVVHALAHVPHYGQALFDPGLDNIDAHCRSVNGKNIQNDPNNPLCRMVVVFAAGREDDFWTLDMSPEQVHITNVKEYSYQKRFWQDAQNGAEDVSTSIGRSQDGKEVEGVDMHSPYMVATVTKFFDEDDVTDEFLRDLEDMTAHVNFQEFIIGGKLRCAPGECLFIAPVIDGLNQRKKVRVQYRFQIRRNREDMEIELDAVFGVAHPLLGQRVKVKVDKFGWEYMWMMKGRYIKESLVAANNQVCVGLVSVHVAKLYESANFADLQSDIGEMFPILPI